MRLEKRFGNIGIRVWSVRPSLNAGVYFYAGWQRKYAALCLNIFGFTLPLVTADWTPPRPVSILLGLFVWRTRLDFGFGGR